MEDLDDMLLGDLHTHKWLTDNGYTPVDVITSESVVYEKDSRRYLMVFDHRLADQTAVMKYVAKHLPKPPEHMRQEYFQKLTEEGTK